MTAVTAVTAYPTAYVQSVRTEFATQVAAYRDLVAAASKASGMSLTRIDRALAAFEPGFFNALLVALDARFAHRRRDGEGEGTNPLAEVRLLVASLMSNEGVLAADNTIAYAPEKAVLRIDVGDRIALNADDFGELCAAYLAEIERKYPPT